MVSCHKDKKTDEPVTGPFVFFEARVGEAGTLPQPHDYMMSLKNDDTGYQARFAESFRTYCGALQELE